ncbi:hypothetical protein [Streptomyces sp. NPDC047071]|uniref:hypothetical protein n=1 Tax=Streptomyces sp. NPDC047071 TaxID=3154808 RepID=UPI0034572458
MTSAKTRKPPTPVMWAVVIWGVLAVAPLAIVLVALIQGAPQLLLFALLTALPGSIAWGLWQGNRGARFCGIFFGFMTLGLGILMILLLAVPRSSRVWFTPWLYEEDG